MVNIGRWSPYEGGQLDRFHCITPAFTTKKSDKRVERGWMMMVVVIHVNMKMRLNLFKEIYRLQLSRADIS
jgi:hypothetical protein